MLSPDLRRMLDGMEQPAVVVSSDPARGAPGAPVAEGATVPFRRLESDEPALVVLHQVSPTHFRLVEGFRYEGRAGSWEVHPDDLPATDLASIPRYMGWFASSYGHHTLPALLHDHLVRNGDGLDPPVPRHRADEVFRETLNELGVPYLRSRMMWAGVTFATRWRSSAWAALALSVWVVAAVAGIATLVWAIATGHVATFLAAAAAPVPFAALWGRRELRVGVVGGYTLWFVALPTLFGILASGLYRVADLVFRIIGLLVRGIGRLRRVDGRRV